MSSRCGRRARGGHPPRQQQQNTTLYVDNISTETSEYEVATTFQAHGLVSGTFMVKDKKTKTSRGQAFVTFCRHQDAAMALKELEGHRCDHMVWKLDWARPRAPRKTRPPKRKKHWKNASSELLRGMGKASNSNLENPPAASLQSLPDTSSSSAVSAKEKGETHIFSSTPDLAFAPPTAFSPVSSVSRSPVSPEKSSIQNKELHLGDDKRDHNILPVQCKCALHDRFPLDRVDNDPWLNPNGVYAEFDNQLTRLAVLTEVAPREAKPLGGKPVGGDSAAGSTSGGNDNSINDTEVGKIFWAKGTGYGHSGAAGWDVDAHFVAQREKDRQVSDVLSRIGADLMPPNGLFETGDAGTEAGNSRIDEEVGTEMQRLRLARSSAPVLGKSCLLPVLAANLDNESLVEISRHARLYVSVLQLCRIFAAWPHLGFLLQERVDGNITSSSFARGKTLLMMLDAMVQRIAIAKKAEQKATTDESTELAAAAQQGRKAIERETSEDAEKSLFDLIVRTHAEAVAAVTVASPRSATPAENPKTVGGSEGGENESCEEIYCRVLGALQYDDAEVLSGFHFKSEATARQTPTSTSLRRLAREHADLSQSLPLSGCSSAWMRVNASRMDCAQFLLSAPEDTPYSGGLFLFDAFFPAQYPELPPRVNLQTTGSGRVRFNPNLYECGKVCLSLLGTWDGEEGETWSAKTSTFLQLIVSIQSLIFVPQPFFNEPGYEEEMGTPHAEAQSAQYNQFIRVQTVRHAMVGMLRSPPAGLEEVVRKHFKLREAYLVSQIEGWIDEGGRICRDSGSESGLLEELIRDCSVTEAAELESLLGEFKAELTMLPRIDDF